MDIITFCDRAGRSTRIEEMRRDLHVRAWEKFDGWVNVCTHRINRLEAIACHARRPLPGTFMFDAGVDPPTTTHEVFRLFARQNFVFDTVRSMYVPFFVCISAPEQATVVTLLLSCDSLIVLLAHSATIYTFFRFDIA